MFAEEYLKNGDVHINMAKGPKTGPPLLFLHGVCRRWQDFSPLFGSLGARHRLVALDARGHGKSSQADRPGAYLVVDHITDVVAALESLDQPAVIYGHSMGAMTAFGAAAAAPDRVQALILEDPPFSTMGPNIIHSPLIHQFRGMKRIAEQMHLSVSEITHELAEMLIQPPGSDTLVPMSQVRDAVSLRFSASCLAQTNPNVLTPVVEGRWLNGYDWMALASEIDCPVLLLRGDESRGGMLQDAEAAWLTNHLRDCLRIDFSGVGHLIHWLQRETLLNHVIGFLESL